MKCRNCGSSNPETHRFCNECGSRLELVCPDCGYGNPPASRFCGGCGQSMLQSETSPLKDLSFEEKLAKIQKYLPGGLSEKILSQRDKIEGERRHVTIMFVDMKGFTPLTEKLGPEETFGLMDQVYEIMIHKVHDYEGTVNELRGDGILALFGAPIALEDGPQRAIRASLAMHREMVKFSAKVKEEKGLAPIMVRIGINTGPVVVGTLGNDLRVQFTAVGDTINMAARMEQLAEPGTTYITEDTFKLTEGFFRFEALGEKEVKGKEETLKVYRVIAPSSRRTRFDVSAERGLTPFVGRERELEIMLDAFERAKAGRGQAVSIVGEAGVGKSRLLYEFRKAVSNEDVTFLEGKCLSYGRNVPYHPIVDILKANFDVQQGDGDSEIREKVRKGLELLEADEALTLPYLLELLSVKDSGIDKIQMSHEGKKDKIIEAIKVISLTGSEIRPLIIAIEDLHWVDKNSENVSKYLLESIPAAKILLLFTYRPEYVQNWGGKSYHSQVTVNRLSDSESPVMAAHVLGSRELDNDLEALIQNKTEGVPFFIEEFIRSLNDLKVIERKDDRCRLARDIQDVTIPSTIQDVIMARVDRLPEGPKEVLQVGSVVEREFSHDLLKEVTGLQEKELLSCLSVLKDSELLYERGIYPASTCIFKHALTREVVYDSILPGRKKKLHEAIGNAIEKLFKANIDEHYGVLAEHYIAGENWERGAEYSKLARKKAEKTVSLNDAIAYSRKRIACLEKLPHTDDWQKKIIDSRTVLGLYTAQMNYLLEAKEAIDPIIDAAEKSSYKRRLCQIYTILGAYCFWVKEDFPLAYKYLEEALQISEQARDLVSLVLANYWLACALSLSCEFEKAFHHFERAIQINVAASNLWGTSAMKSTLSVFVQYFSGKIDLAYETSYEALQIAEESGDAYSKGLAYTAHGMSCFGKGYFQQGIEQLMQAENFCRRIDLFTWNAVAQYWLGKVYFETGEHERSRNHCEKVVQLLWQIRFLPSWMNLCKIDLARAKVMNVETKIDLESLYARMSDNNVRWYEGWMRRYLGEILLNIDDQHTSEAQHWIEEAIAADERNGMRWHLARDYALYGELFKRKGDRVTSKEQLGRAIEIYKECGADGWVTKAEEELASMA